MRCGVLNCDAGVVGVMNWPWEGLDVGAEMVAVAGGAEEPYGEAVYGVW